MARMTNSCRGNCPSGTLSQTPIAIGYSVDRGLPVGAIVRHAPDTVCCSETVAVDHSPEAKVWNRVRPGVVVGTARMWWASGNAI